METKRVIVVSVSWAELELRSSGESRVTSMAFTTTAVISVCITETLNGVLTEVNEYNSHIDRLFCYII